MTAVTAVSTMLIQFIKLHSKQIQTAYPVDSSALVATDANLHKAADDSLLEERH